MSHEIAITHSMQGAYQAAIEGADSPAELTWKSDDGSVRIVDHTFVPVEARGMGIAQHLVEAIIVDARRDGFLIFPTCPYVVKAFNRHPEWSDVLATRQ